MLVWGNKLHLIKGVFVLVVIFSLCLTMANRINNKKLKLLRRKKELLNELRYYETRIEDARTEKNIPSLYEDDSSDSEIEFSINSGTSITELGLQKSQLLTCLRATEELTGVTVLQSEVNVVVAPPACEGEAPITEDGTWREVVAECRIDLVTFSITFHTHQPRRQFAPVRYRALSVTPTKPVQQRELAHSLLPELRAPAAALQVLRSYAGAHRARRTSLARLADKYADCLFMETLPEGGYELRCAGLLRAAWALRNMWSPVAPFYHQLTINLEYMDEIYVKKIMQAHKQLCDPTLDTDDRTSLLAEIIDTCLEARSQIGPESDADSQNSKTNQNSDVENQNAKRPSDQDIDAPIKSSEVMGPPKSLPKKSKIKGKENIVANERKRGSDGRSGEETVKKAKTDAKINHRSKDKTDKKSKNSNKIPHVNQNDNTNNSSNEEVVRNAYFSKNEPENKGNKKTNNLPQVETKAKNTEVLRNTDAVKAKDSAQSKSKPPSAQTAAKSSDDKVSSVNVDKNNDNLNSAENKNLPEKELKAKGGNSNKKVSKINSALKEPSNFSGKNNDANLENILMTQNKNLNPQATSTKNLKTKAIVDGNDPKTKKSKISADTNKKALANAENVDTQSINNPEIAEPRSKEKNIPKDKGETEMNTQRSGKNIKNVAKGPQKNVQNLVTKTNNDKNQNQNLDLSAKKQQNFEQKEKSANNKDLKKVSNKNVQSKESLTKSKNNHPNNALVQNPSNTQTLAERFSKNKIAAINIAEKSNKNTNKMPLTNDNLVENNAKSNQNKEDVSNLRVFKQTLNINVLKPKITKELNKVKVDKNVRKTNSKNNNITQNNQKLRKSIGLKRVAARNNTKAVNVGNKPISKIPLKRFPLTKMMTSRLRISPRTHQSALSSTQNSSKSSVNSLRKHTHIPRLLQKPNNN